MRDSSSAKNGPAAALRMLLAAVIVSLTFVHSAFAQDFTLSGRVVDENGLPLIGAYVVIAGSGNTEGTITDTDGKFSIVCPPQSSIEVSYLGYKTVTHEVMNRASATIRMEPEGMSMEGVVVVAYGTQRKETLTGSISVVDSDNIIETPTTSLSNALVGRVPGISSVQSSGEPGDNQSTLRIRGIATLNSEGQDPLVVIDGIQSTTDAMNALDPNEIESISVLKDASATAVYGVKGANGVVIITTKRGKSGAPRINLSYRFGLTQLTTKLKMLDSYRYALLRNEAIANDGDISKNQYIFDEVELWKFLAGRDYTPNEVNAMPGLTDDQRQYLINRPALYYRNDDNYDKQFGGVAPQQQYNINISGGTDRVRYFASVGYISQEGLFRNARYQNVDNNSYYDRYNFRSNVDMDIIKDYLELSVDLDGSIQNSEGILGKDGDITSSSSRHKQMLVMILSGSPFSGPGFVGDKLINQYIKAWNPLDGRGGNGTSATADIIMSPKLVARTSTFNATARLRHDMKYLTEGLSLSGTVSYKDTYRKARTERYNPAIYQVGINPDNPLDYVFYGGNSSPVDIDDNINSSGYNYKSYSLYLEAKLEYKRKFGKHDVYGLLLYNAQKSSNPGLQFLVPSGMIGSAARITYSYDDRYLLEVNMGYNGSENFPEGKRFGFFPAFSLGWILTNEPYMPKNDILTFFKLRASYGEVGNDKIGGNRFLYLPSTWSYNDSGMANGYGAYFGYSDGTSLPAYYSGAYESRLGNPDVTWERARKANVGVDINMFNDRLTMTGDLFYEHRDGILWSYDSSPVIIGAVPPMGNIGKMENKGYEAQITWSDNIGHFRYSIGAGVSYAVNKILYMDEPNNPYEWMNQTGFSYNQYRGYVSSGFYNNEDEALNRPYIALDGNKVQPGDIRFVDLNGDGIIDSKDVAPIGYSNLPRYAFNGTINIEYKGFSLSALFTGSYGGSMMIGSHYMLNPFYMNNGSAQEFHYDWRWTPEKAASGAEIRWPRTSLRNEDTQNGAANDLYLYSTEHVKLKNLEIGYTFRGKFLEKARMQAVKVYVSGNNLWTFGSKLPDGYDPEQADTGGASDGYLYPPTRIFNIGINLQF